MGVAIADICTKVYRTAIYIRLSREDNKKDKEKRNSDSSESIINQKSLLTKYVEESGYELVDYYIDDGWSGTNFDRPRFNDMIADIEAGKIDMVVTKDLSRLGRDYIGTGEYLERFFPQHNVRYIALTDNIDTTLDNSNMDMAPFKAVFNDMYAKDISKKIRTALKTKQHDGKWVGGCPPFGYMQDPQDKNHLVPNEDEAPIIRKIFELAIQGLSPYQIAVKLTDEKIPTVSMIRATNRTPRATLSKLGVWGTKTVKSMIINQMYTGDLIQNRRSRINYKLKKTVWNSSEDWIIVENTHEPLVSKKDFEYINKTLSKHGRKNEKKNFRLLDGLLRCYDCKHRIGIQAPRKIDGRTYIICNNYRLYYKYNVCTSHSFNYDYLEEGVLDIIKRIAFQFLNEQELRNKAKNIKIDNPKLDLEKELSSLEQNLHKITTNLDKMYLDKLEGTITEDMFNRVSKKLNEEIIEKNDRIEYIKEKIGSIPTKNDISNIECEKLVKEFLQMTIPTRDLILKLIDKIDVHRDKQIDIYFNFKELNFLLPPCHRI